MSSRPRRPRPPAAPVEPDDGYGPSRTELRAVRVAYQARLDALTKRLCSLPPKKLDSLGLDERVVAEVRSLAGMTKGGALARQRRAVAAMLRDYDVNT
ncbi:MAG: DUF615 domain-containing protein, partial [Myxococcales bacterium]|nr:DUF615 domain-containing protein [Myxococcales bacterium]